MYFLFSPECVFLLIWWYASRFLFLFSPQTVTFLFGGPLARVFSCFTPKSHFLKIRWCISQFLCFFSPKKSLFKTHICPTAQVDLAHKGPGPSRSGSKRAQAQLELQAFAHTTNPKALTFQIDAKHHEAIVRR